MFDQPLLLDMIFLGTQKLCGGLYILFFFKVFFEKHPNVQLFPSGKIRVDFIGERESNISGGQFAVNILHCNASIRNMSRVQDTGCRLQTLVDNMHGP